MYALRINVDTLSALTGGLSRALQRPERLAKKVGSVLRKEVIDHLRGKHRTDKNKLGGKRQNFWRQMANSVSQQAEISGDGTQVTVAVTDPKFAQKVYGGNIHARNAKFLTIPVTQEAYGRTAETLEHEEGIKLFFIGRPFGGLLANSAGKGRIKVQYVLKPWVFQLPDPTALPDPVALEKTLAAKATEYLEGGRA